MGTFEVGEKIPLGAAGPETIVELLRLSSSQFQSKPALQIKRNGNWTRLSFSQLEAEAEAASQRLLQLGLRKGDRVVLFSENQPEWGAAYLAAAIAGLVVVPLDSQTWHKEVWSVCAYTDAKAIMLSDRCLAKLSPEGLRANEEGKAPILLLSVNRFCEPFQLEQYPKSCPVSEGGEAEEVEFPDIGPDDIASIIFTTGTAADPRGAVHTHRSFLNNLRGVNHYLSVSETDSLLSVLPLYHALEFSCGFLMAVHRGATVTYANSLKPRALLQTMRETGTTCLLGVPTLFALIRDDIERRILGTSRSVLKTNLVKRSKQFSRSVEQRLGRNIGRRLFAQVHDEFGGSIRVFVSGGSRLGRSLYRDFQAMGIPIYEGYGLTETAPVLTVNPLHRSREGSAGMPLPGVEMRLFQPDEDGIGEIVVRTPSLMKEYYKNPEATASEIKDGWFHTGDLGWVDADGYIYITGRKKDVIVTGAGKNVYPTDLEAIYQTASSIKEICVVGIRNGLTEDVHAAVVLEVSGNGLRAEDQRTRVQKEVQALAKELPSYHRLQGIHIWPEPLPRDQEGRLDRRSVRNQIADQIIASQAPEGRTQVRKRELSLKKPLIEELARLSGADPTEIGEETHLYSDLGLDSLMALELLLFLESHFQTVVRDEKVVNFQTVGDILDELRRTGVKDDGFIAKEPLGSVRSGLPYSERPAIDRAVMGASFSGMKLLFNAYFGLSLNNKEHLPEEGAYIIAANHSSHLDTAAMITALTMALGKKKAQKLHVIGARDYFFDSPLKSWMFSTCLNVVPIERDDISLAGLRQIRSILARNEPILIFPEGTRSRTGVLQQFKPGIGLIAYDTGALIVPAFVEGTYSALPPGKALPKKRRVSVTFGRPIPMGNYFSSGNKAPKDEIYRMITRDVRKAIERLGGTPTQPPDS
jgi:long-chain acyl-CoA synthetase